MIMNAGKEQALKEIYDMTKAIEYILENEVVNLHALNEILYQIRNIERTLQEGRYIAAFATEAFLPNTSFTLALLTRYNNLKQIVLSATQSAMENGP